MSALTNYYFLKDFQPNGKPTKKSCSLFNRHRGTACLCKIDPDETSENNHRWVTGPAIVADTLKKVRTGIVYVLVGGQLVPCE